MEDGGYLPNSDDEGEEDEDGRLKMRSGSESCLSQMEEALENQISMALPPEKVPGMMNYLVSLPMPEEDLGIIVPSPSESGSSFSSPLLTPPDDEGIQHLVRGFQESERKKLQLSEKVDEVKKDEMKSVEGIKVTGYVDQSPDDRHPLATLTPSSPTHTKVARVTSLPTASLLLPSVSVPVEVTSTKSQSVNGDSFKESDDVDDLMNPDEEVKTTLIQSVTYRIKEIEKMNNKSTLERPASAGSQKHISMGSFSVASSEESLHSRPSHPVTSNGDDNGSLSRDKRSSLSPVKGDVTMETILPNILIQSHSEESLPTIPSNEKAETEFLEKTETESVQRNWTDECKTPSPSPNIVPDSPNTVYRKATQAAILLAEQKNQLKFGVMGDNDSEDKPIFTRQGPIPLAPNEDKIDTLPDDGISSTKSIKNSDTQSSEDTSLLNDKHIEKQDIENKPLSPSHNIVPDSPNTVYKKATQMAILLTEQKLKAKLEVAGNNDIDEKSVSLRQPFTFTPLSNIEDSLPNINKISSAVNKIDEVQDSAVVYSSTNHLSRDVSHDKKVDTHTVITQSIKTPSPPNIVPDSPNTVYRKATQASMLLAEKKNQQLFEVTVTREMTLSSGDISSVSGKGVKELTGLFRDEVSGGSVIKRSHSLRERPHSGENLFVQTHKRSSSANTTNDTDPTTELHESHD